MRRSASGRWLLGTGLFLVLAPLVCWVVLPGPEIKYPPDDFIPDHLTGAFCLKEFESVWERHWLHRGGAKPDRALMDLLKRAGVWDRYEEQNGPTSAVKLLQWIQQAVFAVLGEEAWIFLGRWQAGGQSQDEQSGLVFAIRGDVAISDKIGPLLDLILPDVEFDTRIHKQSKIYVYNAERAGHCLAFFHSNGWICGSWRQRGVEPLIRIIDRMEGGAIYPSRSAEFRKDLRQMKMRDSGMSLVFFPKHLWPEIRKFNLQRGRKFSKKSESSLRFWQQRLDQIDRIFIYQHGPSLVDLALELNGDRPRRLAAQYRLDLSSRQPSPSIVRDLGGRVGNGAAGLLEMDLDVALARMIAPILGFSWSDVFDENLVLETWGGEAVSQVNRALSADSDTTYTRIGLAVYPSSLEYLPAVLLWMNQPGKRPEAGSPGNLMSRVSGARQRAGSHDLHWILPLGAEVMMDPGSDMMQWQPITGDVWNHSERQPDAIAAFDFGALRGFSESVPQILLNRRKRRKLEDWILWFDIMDMVCDALGMTLEIREDHWLLELHGHPVDGPAYVPDKIIN